MIYAINASKDTEKNTSDMFRTSPRNRTLSYGFGDRLAAIARDAFEKHRKCACSEASRVY